MGGRVSTRSLPGSLRSPRRSGLHEIHQILPTTTTPPASSPTTTSAPDPDPAHPHPRVVVFSPRVAFFTANNRQERLTDATSLPRGIPSIMGWLHHGQAKSEPVGATGNSVAVRPSTANLHRPARRLSKNCAFKRHSCWWMAVTQQGSKNCSSCSLPQGPPKLGKIHLVAGAGGAKAGAHAASSQAANSKVQLSCAQGQTITDSPSMWCILDFPAGQWS